MAAISHAVAPGHHFETANLRNLLLASGVDLSEAMCLGIAGGIAAGYQFCPSIVKHTPAEQSGIQFIGRAKMMTTNGAWFVDTLSRLGLPFEVKESGSDRAALANLTAQLQQGRPVVAWISPMGISPASSWTATCGMYSILVHAVAEQASISDHTGIRTLPLEQLTEARARVSSLKRRTLSLSGACRVTPDHLRSAVLTGLQECASDFQHPRLGTFNLPGLADGVKMIANASSKRGWLALFPGPLIYLPLQDAFESISMGGSFFRPLYARFLDEAAELLNLSTLHQLAEEYRALGVQWQEFAEWILPFPAIKASLNRLAAGHREELATLAQLRRDVIESFPWDQPRITAFLRETSDRLRVLYDREAATAEQLRLAVS